MDLRTNYLGLPLAHPLMPGASPLVDDLDTVRRLEDAGAAAIVMHSLFEEQITREQLAIHQHYTGHEDLTAEAMSWFPGPNELVLGPDRYLEQIRRIRSAVDDPVIASLNGVSIGGWIEYAQLMEQAGAHALELNLYALPAEAVDSALVETRELEVVRAVCAGVTIPVAVKLTPFYSSLPGFVTKLQLSGAKGVVLFNRLYQPDIDIERLSLDRVLRFSDPSELLLRLRWLAILSPQTPLSLAVSGGVHGPSEVIKAVMAGAHGVQMVSALLQHGPARLRATLDAFKVWLEEHEYPNLEVLRGSMNHARCPDPSAYERANYVRMLSSWHAKT